MRGEDSGRLGVGGAGLTKALVKESVNLEEAATWKYQLCHFLAV